ncbi:uncharacterized protein LOC133884924 [Phragmites australis]|uniref:uncharacterized protein LOC133884924 n=1 Tax=Phragmites australis TaxID=29695 RepID=UPI002D798C8E|nr:uncharacterized protein LOC133884924 [Phragmites australis]
MEERILQPKAEPEAIAEAPSPPQVPFSDDAPGLSSADVESDEEGFEFEFPSISRDSPAGTAALADELFADGRIRTFYPVFGRRGGVHSSVDGPTQPAPAAALRVRGQLGRLFLEESRSRNSSTSSTTSTASSSSSAATDDDGGGLEGASPESYCLWTPGSSASGTSSPRPPRKSSSTGSMARWRRISELVVGRSHSDGKEKFLFLPTPPHKAPNKDKPRPKPSPAGGRKGSTTPAAEADTVTAVHRIAYIAKGGSGGGGTPRRTFLPYREELVGLFANVNGISRSHHHPF